VSCIVRDGRPIAIDTINTATPARKKRKPFEVIFVKLPKYWIDQLHHARKLSTVKLAHVILREAFKRQHVGGEIVLSTEVTGLSRQVKARAVNELRELGLIETEQNGNQAVRVISIIEREEEKKRIGPCVAPNVTRRSLRRDAA
jgi:hypothetical protein